MFNAPVISGFRQVGDFQCDKVNVRFHRPGDLFGCIAIVIDVLKNLIGVEQDFCGNDVRLILRLRGMSYNMNSCIALPFARLRCN